MSNSERKLGVIVQNRDCGAPGGAAGRWRVSGGTFWSVLGWFLLILGSPAQLWAGSIEGYVLEARADGSGPRLAGAVVRVQETGQQAVTGADGTYRIEDVSAGSYHLLISPPPPGYVGQIYGNVPCFYPPSYEGCPVDQGSLLEVPEIGTVANVIFPLYPEAVITGRVTDQSSGLPSNATVDLFVLSDSLFEPTFVGRTVTAIDGSFLFGSLPEGFFHAVASGPGYFGELWRQKPCPVGCDVAEGDQIFTRSGETISGIDFTLAREVQISGRVTRQDDGTPLGFLAVWLHDENGTFLRAEVTDEDGRYLFDLLDAGTYYLRTFASVEWADKIYDGILCPQPDGTCDVTEGTPVVLAEGASTTDVDFELPFGGRIHGTVRSATGRPVGAVVDAWSAIGERLRTAYTELAQGGYQLSGLPSGNYFVTTRLAQGYLPQLYDGLPCGEGSEADCDVTVGTPVSVELGEITTDIDFALESAAACEPTDLRMCLNRGRFAIEITWIRPDGTSGPAHAEQIPGIDDSGYFYFFRPDNVELFVKVLDACNTTFHTYWVFAAGLTNVEVRMKVTDTLTGFSFDYLNPQQRPFQPIQDTGTFKTCP